MQFNFAENGRLIVFILLVVAMLIPWFLSQMRERQNLRWIEAEELSGQLEAKSNPLVVDVRTRGEFTGPLGHIKKATNIPLDELPRRLSEISSHKDKPIVVVCRTDRRASAAAAMLDKAGMTDVSVLRGGMMRWSQLKY